MNDLNLNTFPPITKDQWKLLAEQQLKGKHPDQELQWENKSGMILEGYYDESDLSDLDYLKKYFSALPTHRWKLFEEVTVNDPKEANKKILKALMGGCDGIILTVGDPRNIDAALMDVDRSICDISIKSNQNIQLEKTSGMMMTPDGNCFVTDRTEPIDQISGILQNQSSSFIYRPANPDFFLEIASIRALKFLLDEFDQGPTKIHTKVPNHHSDEHQWFLNTTAGLASVLGGSHSIDFTTAIGDSRISRNTGNLIREESGISEYSDQCGGSYYVEVLTDKIIKGVKENLK